MIECEPFADAAEVDLAAGLLTGDGGDIGMDDEFSKERGLRLLTARFPVFDAAAKRNIKQAAGLHVGIEGDEQALVAGLADVESFAGLHVIDTGDIASIDEPAEARFEEIELLETFLRHAAGDGFVILTNVQSEGGMHGFVREHVGCGHGRRLGHLPFSIQSFQTSFLTNICMGTPARRPRGRDM